MATTQQSASIIINFLMGVPLLMYIIAVAATFYFVPHFFVMLHNIYPHKSKTEKNGIHWLLKKYDLANRAVLLHYFTCPWIALIIFQFNTFSTVLISFLLQFLFYAGIIITTNNLRKNDLNDLSIDTGYLQNFFKSKIRRGKCLICVLAIEILTLFFVSPEDIGAYILFFLIMNGWLMLKPLKIVVERHLQENYSDMNFTTMIYQEDI